MTINEIKQNLSALALEKEGESGLDQWNVRLSIPNIFKNKFIYPFIGGSFTLSEIYQHLLQLNTFSNEQITPLTTAITFLLYFSQLCCDIRYQIYFSDNDAFLHVYQRYSCCRIIINLTDPTDVLLIIIRGSGIYKLKKLRDFNCQDTKCLQLDMDRIYRHHKMFNNTQYKNLYCFLYTNLKNYIYKEVSFCEFHVREDGNIDELIRDDFNLYPIQHLMSRFASGYTIYDRDFKPYFILKNFNSFKEITEEPHIKLTKYPEFNLIDVVKSF